MTAIVGMALGKRDVPSDLPSKEATTANFLLPGSVSVNGIFRYSHFDNRPISLDQNQIQKKNQLQLLQLLM